MPRRQRRPRQVARAKPPEAAPGVAYQDVPSPLKGAGRDGTFVGRLRADQVLSAIGQRLALSPDGLALAGGKIAVTGPGRTSRPGIWAGGDCTGAGEDLTVAAVAQGRDAAEDIHAYLMGGDHG